MFCLVLVARQSLGCCLATPIHTNSLGQLSLPIEDGSTRYDAQTQLICFLEHNKTNNARPSLTHLAPSFLAIPVTVP